MERSRCGRWTGLFGRRDIARVQASHAVQVLKVSLALWTKSERQQRLTYSKPSLIYSTHGFSSELLHYLRALVVANKLGYTLLADDSQWNYGSLSEYFLPRLVYCRPPTDWFDPVNAVRVGSKRWQSKDRVWVGREMELEMDEWVREEMLDEATVSELKGRQSGTILPEGETLPSSLEEVFTDFSGVLKEVWRPNHQVRS